MDHKHMPSWSLPSPSSSTGKVPAMPSPCDSTPHPSQERGEEDFLPTGCVDRSYAQPGQILGAWPSPRLRSESENRQGVSCPTCWVMSTGIRPHGFQEKF